HAIHLGACFLALGSAACWHANRSSFQAVKVTGASSRLPPTCRPGDVIQKFNELLVAMGRGDDHIVEKFFGGSQENGFYWVSIEDRRKSPNLSLNIYTKSRDTLAMYFAKKPYMGQVMHVTGMQMIADTVNATLGFAPV